MRYKLQEVVINIWCGALDAAAMKREFQSVEDYENAYAKYKAKVEQAAIDDILDLLDKSDLESAIKRCGYGFRSLSLHSDGRWIAKSGAGTGKFLTTAKTPLEAILKLEAKLDVRKVIEEG